MATHVSTGAASALQPVEMAHSVNVAYLNLLLPFWWEHVLLRSRLDEADDGKKVKELLAPPPPLVYDDSDVPDDPNGLGDSDGPGDSD